MIESNGKNYLTWDEIQEKHGISRRTLERWLDYFADITGKNLPSSFIRGEWCMMQEDYEKLAASRALQKDQARTR